MTPLVLAQEVSADTTAPTDGLKVIQEVAFCLSIENYTCATEILNGLEDRDNAEWNRLVDVLKATFFLSRALDLGDSSDVDHYLQAHHRAEKSIETSDAPQSNGLLFLLDGTLLATHAQYFNEFLDKPLKAIGPAEHSADAMEKALDLNPDFEGARVSLALYRFWHSHVLRSLAWTPFVADRREESLAILRTIANSESPYRVSAAIGMSWALVEMGRSLEGAALADSMRTALGEELRGLLEPAGKGYYLAGRWEPARQRYDSLLVSLRHAPHRSLVREIGVLNRLAHIAREQGDWQAVLQYTDDALSLPMSQEQAERKHDDLKRLRELQHQAGLELE